MSLANRDKPLNSGLRRSLDYSSLAARLVRMTVLLTVLLAVAILLSASLGAVAVPPEQVLKVFGSRMPYLDGVVGADVAEVVGQIVWNLRVPRVLLGALVGMCLAVSGCVLQGLLRNPLADPYIIGVSSGAALGAGIAVLLGLSGTFMGFGVPLFAFASALAAVTTVYLMARRDGDVSMLSFILAGVVVGSFMWAALTFVISVAGRDLEKIVFWTMGSLAGNDPWSRFWVLLPFAVLGFAALCAYARDLNIFALGEEPAQHLGLDVERLKRVVIGVSALVTAAAVSVSGTIGFVGLIVPHICRRMVGPDHRILMPCSALVGALLMICADTLSRTLIAPAEVPVGVITALLGAPFFLYLLRKTRR